MSPPDDIRGETPSSESESGIKSGEPTTHRSVGPESETRGGPEAVDETLDDDALDPPESARGYPNERPKPAVKGR